MNNNTFFPNMNETNNNIPNGSMDMTMGNNQPQQPLPPTNMPPIIDPNVIQFPEQNTSFEAQSPIPPISIQEMTPTEVPVSAPSMPPLDLSNNQQNQSPIPATNMAPIEEISNNSPSNDMITDIPLFANQAFENQQNNNNNNKQNIVPELPVDNQNSAQNNMEIPNQENHDIGLPDFGINNGPVPVNQREPEPTIPNEDAPLFPQSNGESIDIPIATPMNSNDNPNQPPLPELSMNSDQFNKVKELLNNNGINFKAYSNETGHCIIIEI